jgi:hypothetical protein
MNKNKIFTIVLVVIIGLVALFFSDRLLKPLSQQSAKGALHIASVSPVENGKNVGLSQPIIIVFEQPLSSADQNDLQVTISPEVFVERKWLSDNRTIVFTPLGVLHSNQQYTVTVTSGGIMYSWKFQTPNAENVSREDKLKAQEEGDKGDAAFQDAIYKTFPWYDSFPLQQKNYFVYYDVENKKLIGKLYPQKKASVSVDSQVSQMKTEIEARVKKIGVDTSKFPIEWNIMPE